MDSKDLNDCSKILYPIINHDLLAAVQAIKLKQFIYANYICTFVQ